MKKITALLFLLSGCSFFAQVPDTLENRLCIKIAPLSLLDIYSGMSPRAGIEYKVKNTFSIYQELGTYLSGPNSIQNNKGVLTKFEFKKYFNKHNFSSGNYFSAELFFKHQSFTNTDSISLNPKIEKNYKVTKDVACLTFKYGKLSVFTSNIVFDAFVGLGIRYKVSRSTLTQEEQQHVMPVGDYHLNLFVGEAGNFFYPNFDAGIKIGYRIK